MLTVTILSLYGIVEVVEVVILVPALMNKYLTTSLLLNEQLQVVTLKN